MRRATPQTKALLAVRIPESLREKFAIVLEHICDVENDLDHGLEYEDGIQTEGLIGGRCGTDNRPFVFTYYPSEPTNPDLWHLTLARDELEEIASGSLTRIKLYCCKSSTCRMKFRESDELCFFCDYTDEQT